MMLTREVLVIVPVSDHALRGIAAVGACLHGVDAQGWFDVELRETWPPWTVQRYFGQRLGPISSHQERDWPAPRSFSGLSVSAGWLSVSHNNLLRGRATALGPLAPRAGTPLYFSPNRPPSAGVAQWQSN